MSINTEKEEPEIFVGKEKIISRKEDLAHPGWTNVATGINLAEIEKLKGHFPSYSIEFQGMFPCHPKPEKLCVDANFLKNKLADSYVEQSEKQIALRFLERKSIFLFLCRDSDIFPIMKKKWEEKGLRVNENVDDSCARVLKNNELYFCITLEW